MRGQDFFRSAVIEALGDYHATYAVAPIIDVAKLDGPLQEDAVLALGKIGDKRALEMLEALQRSAPREPQPAIAAAICLLGINCESHQKYRGRHADVRDQDDRASRICFAPSARGLGALARRRPRGCRRGR